MQARRQRAARAAASKAAWQEAMEKGRARDVVGGENGELLPDKEEDEEKSRLHVPDTKVDPRVVTSKVDEAVPADPPSPPPAPPAFDAERDDVFGLNLAGDGDGKC